MSLESGESDNKDQNVNDNNSLTWSLHATISNAEKENFDGILDPNHTFPPWLNEFDYFK